MNVQELEDLLRQLLMGIQEVLQSGEVIPDEFAGQIAQTLSLLINQIERLRGSGGPPPQKPELTQAMPSSNIEAFGYDDKTNRLLVRFLGEHPNRNGPVYSYEGVPKVIFDLFQKGSIPARTNGKNRWGKWWKGKVPSLGASLFTLIKNGGYQYQRLS